MGFVHRIGHLSSVRLKPAGDSSCVLPWFPFTMSTRLGRGTCLLSSLETATKHTSSCSKAWNMSVLSMFLRPTSSVRMVITGFVLTQPAGRPSCFWISSRRSSRPGSDSLSPRSTLAWRNFSPVPFDPVSRKHRLCGVGSTARSIRKRTSSIPTLSALAKASIPCGNGFTLSRREKKRPRFAASGSTWETERSAGTRSPSWNKISITTPSRISMWTGST